MTGHSMISALSIAQETVPVDLPRDAGIGTLLTVQYLLVVALVVAAFAAGREAASARLPVAAGAFGMAVAGLVTLFGIGAAAVWYRRYIPEFPDHETQAVEAIALLLAMIAAAVLSWWVALGLRGR